MRSGRHHRSASPRRGPVTLLIVALLMGLVAGVPAAVADEISDQRAEVQRIADRLEALENRIGELAEQHAAALDRLDELDVEIIDAQAGLDSTSAALGALQRQLGDIAVAAFMSGGANGLGPLFSDVGSFIDSMERGELTRVALDQGAGTSDEMQALVTDLTERRAMLDRKLAEQQQLIASLDTARTEGEALTLQYEQDYAAAEARLGRLVREEQERRAAAQLAAAQAAAAQAAAAAAAAAAAPAATVPPRGAGAAPAPAATPATPEPAAAQPPSTEPAPPSVPPPSSRADIAVAAAYSQLGVRYRFAASSPGVAFDCSGLTKYAWGQAGVYLPHQSARQFATTPRVPKDQAQPGDLIYYHQPIGHVAIYIGGGQLIHAPAPGDVVKISKVNWSKVVGVTRPG